MKLFVWDFHGVLERGNDGAVLEITNTVLEQHGYERRMTMEESFSLSGKRWHEYFTHLLPEAEHEIHFELQLKCFEISQKYPEITSKHIRLADHADYVLNQIDLSSHCQILISNSAPRALDKFVEFVNIGKYFPPAHRFGADTHTKKQLTKIDCLNEFLQDKEPFESIVSIGDSPGDMALIHQESIAQGIGYLYSHPEKQHREAKSHYKIQDLRAVLQEL
jgi:phosphoglycolate phosphatase-like HAD superfamily hydrolase